MSRTYSIVCPRCGAQPDAYCVTALGMERRTPHDARVVRELPETKKLKHSYPQQIKMLSARLANAEKELVAVKRSLSEHKIENKRLVRLLHNSDAGVIASLRHQLAEAQKRVRYLTMEILD